MTARVYTFASDHRHVYAKHSDPLKRAIRIGQAHTSGWRVAPHDAGTAAQQRAARELGAPARRRVAINDRSGYVAIGLADGYMTVSPFGDHSYYVAA